MNESMMNYDQTIAQEKQKRKQEVEANFDFSEELIKFVQKEYGMVAKYVKGSETIVEDMVEAVEMNEASVLRDIIKKLETRISYLYEKRDSEEEYRYVIKLQLMIEEIEGKIDNEK